MNCQGFTSFVVEVARGQLMEAASRESAMRHAETCEACAARLEQERNLTAALRTFASSLNESGAPARVEANLLAAFHETRDNRRAAQTPAATTSPAPGFPSTKTASMSPASRRWTRRIAVAAAPLAASLVLVAFAVWRIQLTSTPSPREMTTIDRQASESQSPPPPQGEGRSSPVPTRAIDRERNDQPPSDVVTSTPLRRPTPKAAVKSARSSTPEMIWVDGVIDGGSAIIDEAGAAETALLDTGDGGAPGPAEAERLTDFMPLVAGAPAPPLESGQLVRVELPRSALASLGLPVNVEREHELVKADVLLGNDGLARAIRFVR